MREHGCFSEAVVQEAVDELVNFCKARYHPALAYLAMGCITRKLQRDMDIEVFAYGDEFAPVTEAPDYGQYRYN